MSGNTHDIRTLMFADFCESSKLLTERGDADGMACLNTALQFLARIVVEHDGTVHERIGDELMCSFIRPEAAARAAGAVHRQARDRVVAGELDPCTRFRIGLHTGPVLFADGMPQGDAVHTARRMASLSKPDQVILSADSARQLHAPHQVSYVDTIRIKGKTGEIPIFELVWDELGATIKTGKTEAVAPAAANRLLLSWRDARFGVTREMPVLVIGRDPACDVCIPSQRVSRQHARIEWIKGQLILFDTSSNGLVLRPERQPERTLHREDCLLQGSGQIVLDHEVDPLVLTYVVHDAP